jgi:hypothetical protein
VGVTARSTTAIAAFALTAVSLVAVPPVVSSAAAATVTPTRSDFDGDGLDDVATQRQGGGVVVVRFTGTGATTVLSSPADDDVPGGTHRGGQFGYALAAGDFDGDGMDDLAVGDASEYVIGTTAWNMGGVWVFWGGPTGLTFTGRIPTHLHQDTPGVPGLRERNDAFGWSMTAGDLTGDGRADLVVGAPFEALGSAYDAGMVTFIPGADGGFDPLRSRNYTQSTPGVGGAPERGDNFGYTMAVGDVTGDGRRDLAITTSSENLVGMVQVLPGTADGPVGTGSTGVMGTSLTPGPAYALGHSLAIADVSGDGLGEVIAGAPRTLAGRHTAGAVAILRGTPTGIAVRGSQLIGQSTSGVPGNSEDGDAFGWHVAAADITGDGKAEVFVGVGSEDLGARRDAGMYVVLRGTSSGASGAGSFSVAQDAANVPGEVEAGDLFGESLSLLQIDRDGRPDLVVGAVGEKTGLSAETGYVAMLITGANGRPAVGSRSFTAQAFTWGTEPLERIGDTIA